MTPPSLEKPLPVYLFRRFRRLNCRIGDYWLKLSRESERLSGDVETRFGTIKRLQTAKPTIKEFFELLADQIPDRYSNTVRYLGLLAPRSGVRCRIFLQMLWQKVRPRRVGGRHWLYWRMKRFGTNLLLDSNGELMTWKKSVDLRTTGTPT